MRKNISGRRFKRDSNQRKALFKGLMSSLVLDEKIQTTEAKAKAIKSDIDKMVTKAKKREKEARRFLLANLTPPAADKVIDWIAPQFAKRPGGYTRIIRMGNRVSDSASVVVMEWSEVIQRPGLISKEKVEKQKTVKASPSKKDVRSTKKTAPKKEKTKVNAKNKNKK